MGYRHFDCAPAYQNHKAVGKHLLAGLEETGIKRSEIFVTSKLANDGHTKVREHLTRTLEELGLEYLDLYLIHWPWPNYHPPGCQGDYINPESRHYVHKLYMETYRELEKAYEEGLVKNIGVSNMTVPKMELLLRDCKVKPAVNQVEIHLHFQQEALVKWHKERGVAVTGYFPLGSPGRADRDKAAHHTVPLQDPVLVALAKEKGCSVVEAALKFQMQRGVAVIPQSANPDHMRSNLLSAKLANFSEADMTSLLKTDKNIRFIAGQVFNWKKGMDWHDLWDDLGKDTWDGPINGSQAQECKAEEKA
jgi:diketogulonate reductase-like aldo/keto reductase